MNGAQKLTEFLLFDFYPSSLLVILHVTKSKTKTSYCDMEHGSRFCYIFRLILSRFFAFVGIYFKICIYTSLVDCSFTSVGLNAHFVFSGEHFKTNIKFMNKKKYETSK